jgi:beta-glucuronidase
MADRGSVNKQLCIHIFSCLFVGVIEYNVSIGGKSTNHTTVSVSLLNQDGSYVIRGVVGHEGNLQVPQAKLWWPYLMDPDPAYLYTLEVR